MKKTLIVTVHMDPPISGVACSSEEWRIEEVSFADIAEFYKELHELVLKFAAERKLDGGYIKQE